MSITQIDFSTTRALTAAVRSLYDPDKQLTQGSALTFMKLEQQDSSTSTLTAYIAGEGWLERQVSSQGITGTTYLFDADDLLTRVNEKLDVWKENGLRITQTPSNQMKVDCILPNSKRLKLTNNILVGTYSGDISEFEDRVPSKDEPEELMAVLSNDLITNFFHALTLCDTFSVLRADTQDRAIWLWCKEGTLYLTATERGGSQGHAMLRVAVGMIEGQTNWNLGLKGRQLVRCGFVSRPVYSDEEGESTLSIKLTEDRALIVGSQGSANLPDVEPYHCRALTEGAACYFFDGSKMQVDKKAYRIFDLQDLINAVQLQTPKKNASRNDVVFEEQDSKMVCYKRSDSKKSERAEVVPASTDGLDQEWLPIVIDHSYLTDSLKALKTYLIRQQKIGELGALGAPTSFEFDEELSDDDIEFESSEVRLLVQLTQAENTSRAGHHLVYIQPFNNAGCMIVLMVQTKERTADYEEE